MGDVLVERGKQFADIAYTVLVVEKRHPVAEVAAALGMGYAALHARLINRTCFSADEIRALVAAVPDPRLVGYLLEGSAFVAADRIAHASGLTVEIHRGAARVVIGAADVLKSVDEALDDWTIDHQEGRLILDEIMKAERALASLRLAVAKTGTRKSEPYRPQVN